MQQNFYPFYQQQNNSNFMVVPNEDVIRTFPVAPGTSMTFKVENQPIVIEKIMGVSQLEPPRFDRYRLVKEEEQRQDPFSELIQKVNALEEEIKTLKKRPVKRKETEDDTE